MRHWHIYLIGVLALMWNSIGAFDYVMTQTKNADYLAQFTPEQLAYFDSYPAWVQAFWAIAVWLGVLGSLLLLFRSRFASPVFAVSFLSMLVTMIYNFGLAEVKLHEVTGQEAIYFSLFIFVIALFLWFYALRMVEKRRLR